MRPDALNTYKTTGRINGTYDWQPQTLAMHPFPAHIGLKYTGNTPPSIEIRPLAFTRRKFLGLLTIGSIAVTFTWWSYPRVRHYKDTRIQVHHIKSNSVSDAINESAIETTVHFTGSLFGIQLTSEQKEELITRLTFAAKSDSGWHDEYIWLAKHVDDLAEKSGNAGFSAADFNQRLAITDQVMTYSPSSRRSKLWSLFSDKERYRRRMRITTIEHLESVYINSGAPWMARGYTTWPGVPGNPRWYTQPGPEKQC